VADPDNCCTPLLNQINENPVLGTPFEAEIVKAWLACTDAGALTDSVLTVKLAVLTLPDEEYDTRNTQAPDKLKDPGTEALPLPSKVDEPLKLGWEMPFLVHVILYPVFGVPPVEVAVNVCPKFTVDGLILNDSLVTEVSLTVIDAEATDGPDVLPVLTVTVIVSAPSVIESADIAIEMVPRPLEFVVTVPEIAPPVISAEETPLIV
jgi:hypothetical protein